MCNNISVKYYDPKYLDLITIQSRICVETLSLLRTDPEVYDDKKQKHLKRFHSKVVTKIELNQSSVSLMDILITSWLERKGYFQYPSYNLTVAIKLPFNILLQKPFDVSFLDFLGDVLGENI
jgi:hypothetical protein